MKYLEGGGGTVYNRCYTPAPDTPRSNACLWSSRYPKDNGCNTRIKYPQYYMNAPEQSLLNLLLDNGYHLNIYMDEADDLAGILPQHYEGANYSGNVLLEKYLNELEIQDDSVTYFCLDDFHSALYDYSSTWEAVKVGNEKVSYALRLIEKKLGLDTFDIITVFSDHGFKFIKDMKNMGIVEQLDDDRTKIFMYTRRKGENQLKVSNKLSSIMDIYPTICDVLNVTIPYSIEGKSLFGKEKYYYIIIEDHKNFNVDLQQALEYWGIIDEDGISVIDSCGEWRSYIQDDEDRLKNYKSILEERASFFSENLKAQKILNYYHNCLTNMPYYCDGELRKKAHQTRHKIKMVVKKILFRIMGIE